MGWRMRLCSGEGYHRMLALAPKPSLIQRPSHAQHACCWVEGWSSFPTPVTVMSKAARGAAHRVGTDGEEPGHLCGDQ